MSKTTYKTLGLRSDAKRVRCSSEEEDELGGANFRRASRIGRRWQKPRSQFSSAPNLQDLSSISQTCIISCKAYHNNVLDQAAHCSRGVVPRIADTRMADTFTGFARLPCELRNAIWEATFPSRALTFIYKTPEYEGPLREESELVIEPKDRIFPAPLIRKSMWDLYHDVPVEPIVALRVCQESRRTAMKAGYRIWDHHIPDLYQQNEFGKRMHGLNKRNGLWNPKFDVVHFVDRADQYGLRLFWLLSPGGEIRAFVEQMELAQLLNIERRWWKGKGRTRVTKEGMVEVWKGYDSLPEITTVLKYAIERVECTSIRRYNGGPRTRTTIWLDEILRDMGKKVRPE